MGVYIKGMKKPSDCQYCVMYRDGYCGAKGGFCHSEKGVDADCPIVEVVEVNESEIPNSSENPNNCETCRHNKLEWYSEVCDGCSKAHSNYEPKTEPQTEIRKDVPVICAECDHVSIHQKYLFCELSHRTVYNAKPEWCPLPKLFIADDEPKVEPQTERSE